MGFQKWDFRILWPKFLFEFLTKLNYFLASNSKLFCRPKYKCFQKMMDSCTEIKAIVICEKLCKNTIKSSQMSVFKLIDRLKVLFGLSK